MVAPSDVGVRAWHRMLRDGVLVPATSAGALAPDITHTATTRALAVSPLVTQRGALTGVAALWVWGCGRGPCPGPLDLAVARGAHPDPPPRTGPQEWRWHTDSAAMTRAHVLAGIAVCSPADALVAALRRADLGLAIELGSEVLRRALCTRVDVDDALGRSHPNGEGRARAAAAWRELRALSFEAAASRP